MINSHGTIIMIDPVLEGFDMPLLIDMPILTREVPKVDVVLVSHSDNDHYSSGRDRYRTDTCRPCMTEID